MILPPGPYGCLLADPPWRFITYDGRGVVPQRGDVQHYPTMSLRELGDLPVENIAAKDCALFMWVVDSHLTQAITLAECWGFKFSTCAFVWVKSKKGGWPIIGMGHWTRKQTEQCWLFTRGKPKRIGKGVEQVIYSRRGRHSAKPEQQYERIEALVAGPRLEMFGRVSRAGWDACGDEVGKNDGELFRLATPADPAL